MKAMNSVCILKLVSSPDYHGSSFAPCAAWFVALPNLEVQLLPLVATWVAQFPTAG
jgi:hypothetical protein